MANGKGWLNCTDCSNLKANYKKKEKLCLKHNKLLPDEEKLDFRHIFCSDFIPNISANKILNGAIIQENNNFYYYVYKSESPFYNSEYNEKIELKINTLYGYVYSAPENIEVVLTFN